MIRNLLGGLLCTALAACDQGPVTIAVDNTVTYQTITGWEANGDVIWEVVDPVYENGRFEIYDRAVNEVGINRLRLEVVSGSEQADSRFTEMTTGKIDYETWKPKYRYQAINDNGDPHTINWDGFDFSNLDQDVETAVLPVKERVEARGEKLFINLCYVAFTKHITGTHLHEDPEEYAELILATYQHLEKKYGFVPDAVEAILEPDLSPRWTPEWLAAAVVATGNRLTEAGYEPRFIVPSTMDMSRALDYIDALEKTGGALDHVMEFSYHRYRGASISTLKKIAKHAEKAGVGTSMLEWWFGNADHQILYQDLKIGQNTAWEGRSLRDLFSIDDKDPARPVITLPEDTRMNNQYTRYVRAGAKRIEASSSNESWSAPLAFINTDGGYVVAIKAARRSTFKITGLPSATYEVSYAVAGESSGDRPILQQDDGAITVSIPGPGVLTVFSGMVTKPPFTAR